MWELIVSVPDHCLSFYFLVSLTRVYQSLTLKHNRDQYQTSIDRSVRLRSRAVKHTCEQFCLKRINVKYMNAILSHIDCFVLTCKD